MWFSHLKDLVEAFQGGGSLETFSGRAAKKTLCTFFVPHMFCMFSLSVCMCLIQVALWAYPTLSICKISREVLASPPEGLLPAGEVIPHVHTRPATTFVNWVVDSIAASLFVLNWLSWQIVSDDMIQITILILRRGALSPHVHTRPDQPLQHYICQWGGFMLEEEALDKIHGCQRAQSDHPNAIAAWLIFLWQWLITFVTKQLEIW